MKNVNVKVVMNQEGQVEVVGLNKDGSVSAVNYTVIETAGVREFGVEMMKQGAKKQLEAAKSKGSEPKASDRSKKQESKRTASIRNKKGYESIKTNGRMFSGFKGFKHEDVFHAVKFDVAGKGECIVGFAKDRNQFVRNFNGKNTEVTRTQVIKDLAKYEGKDVAKLVKMVKNLKPVTMAAGVCSGCGCDVSRSVKNYSERKYGTILCRPCQEDFGKDIENNKAPSESEAQQHLDNVLKQDTCVCGNKKLVDCNMCTTCADKEWDAQANKEAELLDEPTERSEGGEEANEVSGASEERISDVKDSADEVGPEVEANDQGFFSPEELMVNAGVKGMDSEHDGPVE